ncbi:MAG TPA: hypothetical protein VL048_15495 [Xanthobacteraceae bacterium]|nr:hypothetical protein [Xanthobacteraceae bacterium]
MTENSPSNLKKPIRARRWSGPRTPPERPRPYRFALRLIGIPAAAVAAVLIYRGLRDRFVLPACDSERAKHSLADVLKELRLEPTRYAPIKTVSSTKDQVVCSAVLPLPGGDSVAADFTFYWQGSTAHMKYAVTRQKP